MEKTPLSRDYNAEHCFDRTVKATQFSCIGGVYVVEMMMWLTAHTHTHTHSLSLSLSLSLSPSPFFSLSLCILGFQLHGFMCFAHQEHA